MIGSSQHGYMKGKSLTKLIALYDEMTGLVEEGKAVDVVHLDLRKAFNAVSHNILINKLITYGLGEWIMSWTEN